MNYDKWLHRKIESCFKPILKNLLKTAWEQGRKEEARANTRKANKIMKKLGI